MRETQGESNAYQVTVTILCRLCPPLPEGELAIFWYWNPLTMGPEMITQIIRKPFFCVADVHVIGKLIPRQFMCVIGAFTESSTKQLLKAPDLHSKIPARKPCATDVLCN